jgi:hypothetical protein
MAIITLNNNSLSSVTSLPNGVVDADALASGVGGKVLQVLTATDDTERSTTSTSMVTASNTLSVDITPASTSSKFFIQVNAAGYNDDNGATCHYTVYRDSTDLGNGSQGLTASRTDQNSRFPTSFGVLDSPSASSQITYQVYFRAGSGTAKLGAYPVRKTITVFEISG